MAKKPKFLEDLFHDTLKDIYYAENKILKTLPKMAKAAQSKELKAAFTKHERETRGQIKRLDSVFKIIGKPTRGKTCAAINGITKEGAEITTSAALFITAFAGLLAGQGHTFTPSALGIATAALLAWKEPLAGFSHALTEAEFRSAILLAMLAFVAYPVLPPMNL